MSDERLRELERRWQETGDPADEAAFTQFMEDEGWFKPFEQLTKPWASVLIDALKAPDEPPDDLPPISTDPDHGEPTDRQVDYLRSLKRRAKLDLEGLHEVLRGLGISEPVDRISRSEMSQLIDALKQR